MSRSGKLKANSQPGLKKILWNVLFPEHETWRKSMWKKAKNLFILPFFFGRIRPSNGFLLPFSVWVCFFQVKGKREVGSYNQLINLYSTWWEFHPFLYPGYSHKSQTDQSEHWFHDAILLLLDAGPFFRRSLPILHHLTTVGSEVQHSESSSEKFMWNVIIPATSLPKGGAYALLLAQRFFQCNTMQMMPKELQFIAPFPRSACLPLFPLLSTI